MFKAGDPNAIPCFSSLASPFGNSTKILPLKTVIAEIAEADPIEALIMSMTRKRRQKAISLFVQLYAGFILSPRIVSQSYIPSQWNVTRILHGWPALCSRPKALGGSEATKTPEVCQQAKAGRSLLLTDCNLQTLI